jgi:predicted SAM-dependent methyltransferase
MKESAKQFLKQFPPLVAGVRSTRTFLRDRDFKRRCSRSYYERQIASYLKAHSPGKLQIGSGPHALPGWLNTDFEPFSREFVYLDAAKPFPLPDQAFTHVFSEHMIEHVAYDQGLAMLRESFRVLQPGGRIRIATPNIRQMVDLFAEPKTEAQRRYLKWSMELNYPGNDLHNACLVLNAFVRNWGHLFVYDPGTLQATLEKAGFVEVSREPVGQSHDKVLRGLECHDQQIGEEWNTFETMVLEGRRPPQTAA